MKRDTTQLSDLKAFAEAFLIQYPQGGVFGLKGDLGVGKTTFVRYVLGLIRERQGQPEMPVKSPSYVLHQSYGTKPSVDHFDFYRLEEGLNEASLLEIGFWEAEQRAQTGGYVFVEWPERAAAGLIRFSACLVWDRDGLSRSVSL